MVCICCLWAVVFMQAAERTDDSVMWPLSKTKNATPLGENTSIGITLYGASGIANRKVRGKLQTPILVIDTVSIRNGIGMISLNEYSGHGFRPVTPSSAKDIHVIGITEMLEDSTSDITARVYGRWLNVEMNQLMIKSNDTAGVQIVEVSFIIQ